MIREARTHEQQTLAALLRHSLLQVRRAAFAPEIGVPYTETIRADIEQEILRMEKFIVERMGW